MARHTRYTHGDTTPDSRALPIDGVKRAFARRLQSAMLAKGLSQADLVRELERHMDPAPHRSLVSNYIRQVALPQPKTLHALAKVLSVEPTYLLPTNGDNEAVTSQGSDTALKDIGGGQVWLKINQAVSWPTALKILELLNGESNAAPNP